MSMTITYIIFLIYVQDHSVNITSEVMRPEDPECKEVGIYGSLFP